MNGIAVTAETSYLIIPSRNWKHEGSGPCHPWRSSAFSQPLNGDPSKYLYLLFLPLIWIALRGGFIGAAIASGVVQVGVVLVAHGGPMQSLAPVELQALVSALSLTGLFLAVLRARDKKLPFVIITGHGDDKNRRT